MFKILNKVQFSHEKNRMKSVASTDVAIEIFNSTKSKVTITTNGSIRSEKFYEEIHSRYFEVTNDYYAEYEKLRKARKVHKVLDLDEKGS